jgi:2'-5' RNA ligase
MAVTYPASAIVVRVPLPPRLAGMRKHWDQAASVGVPAHVTILFPFLPAERLGSEVRRELASIASAQEPFEVRFDRVGRFPRVVYLVPEPSTPFTHLTEAVVARYPNQRPYGGAFAEVIPHLTICESDEAPQDDIAVKATGGLPFTHRVSTLEVLVEAGDGRWRSRWRLPLGRRA